MSFALFTLSGTSYPAVFPAELLVLFIKLMLKLLLKFFVSVLSVLGTGFPFFTVQEWDSSKITGGVFRLGKTRC